MIFKRHYDAEIIDDFSIKGQKLDAALDELNIINFWLGGDSISREAINYIIEERKLHKTVKVLDIGAGGSHLYYNLKKRNINLQWVSADLNSHACRFYKLRDKNSNSVCCNALGLPFKEKSFEIVHASLFLHHFKNIEILRLIESFRKISSAGLVINDLRRNFLAYLGIRILTIIFSRSKMVKNDGPLSVKKGFLKSELIILLNQAGVKNYIIKRKWAFRWMIIILIGQQAQEMD